MYRVGTLLFLASLSLLVALAGTTACSSDSDQNGFRCAPGATFNPDLGRCVPNGLPGTGQEGSGEPGSQVSGAPTSGADRPIPGACPEGERVCGNDGFLYRCRNNEPELEDECAEEDRVCRNGACRPTFDCTAGEVFGCWSETEREICTAEGNNTRAEACPVGEYCWQGNCGAQRCEPGSTRCLDENVVQACSADGERWEESQRCEEEEDLVCSGGRCVGGCQAVLDMKASNVGCEFWAADLPAFQDPFSGGGGDNPIAVIISNVSERPAEVTVESYSGLPIDNPNRVVAPGAVEVIRMPIDDFRGTGRYGKTFRIQSTELVIAYQFNPYDNVGAASNDSSLLLPSNALGTEYYILTMTAGDDRNDSFLGDIIPGGDDGICDDVPDFMRDLLGCDDPDASDDPDAIDYDPAEALTSWFTVIATRTGRTEITVTFADDVLAHPEIAPNEFHDISKGESRTFVMEQGEILSFEAVTDVASLFDITQRDLTGSRVTATQPVAVFAGHRGAGLSDRQGGGGDDEGSCCLDRLEQQMIPVTAWGSEYVSIKSPSRGGESDIWRVMAARDATTITTDPPISGLNGITLNAGQFAEAITPQSFRIEGSGPIAVGQYLVGQERTSRGIGDPTFVLMPPVTQLRDNYVVLTPDNYREDWLAIIRRAGEEVTLEGNPLPDSDFQNVGGSEWQVGWFSVGNGAHSLRGSAPFGVVVYGYDSAVSHGYPGGLDIDL